MSSVALEELSQQYNPDDGDVTGGFPQLGFGCCYFLNRNSALQTGGVQFERCGSLSHWENLK